MALVIADRVRETTTTTGTGTITLAGPYTGFQAFSVIGNGNTTYYAIIDAATGAWEVGIGTYTTAGNTLSRTTILSSSNGGAAVNFGVGTKDVIITQPAARAVYLDTASNATIPGITLSGGTANGVPYLNASKVLTTGSALTFDGTTLSNETGSGVFSSRDNFNLKAYPGSTNGTVVDINSAGTVGITKFSINNAEQMRLTSTGLGIGTSSPGVRLDVTASGATVANFNRTTSNGKTLDIQLVSQSVGWLGSNANGDFVISSTSGGLSSNQMVFAINGTTNMRLDSSGNLGLGVTPSAWGSGRKALQIAGSTANYFMGANANATVFGTNAFHDGSDNKYIANGFANLYLQSSGQHQWLTAPSGTAGAAITFTQAMTLDASGNLGLGTTSPTARFDCYGPSDVYMCLRTGSAEMTFNTGTGFTGSTATSIWNKSAIPMVFGTNNTERARIDSSGNLLVGTTSVGTGNSFTVNLNAGNGTYTQTSHPNGTGSGVAYAQFLYNGSNIGSITQNGTTGVLYNLTSDYRLKNNAVALTGSGAFIDALQPKTWDWWDGSGKGIGFIAHEFMEVAKYSGNGEKDAVDADGNPVYQSIQPSSSEMMAYLVAEIQSLRKRLAALEAK